MGLTHLRLNVCTQPYANKMLCSYTLVSDLHLKISEMLWASNLLGIFRGDTALEK